MNKEGKIIHKELSYQIVGCCFNVYNNIGFGYKEKVYQHALEKEFDATKVNFESQVYAPVKFRGEVVGKHYFDFLIEKTIVLELKVGDHFLTKDIKQVSSYLAVSNLQLGMIVNITSNGVKFKRILNII